MSDLISVIVPSFNQGAFIEKTIQSIINQSYTNWELIIIDGGSKDETLSIVERYNSYITYFCSEKDEGQSHAITKGFEIATGSILCWLNSDDVFEKDTLYLVSENLKSREYLWTYGGGEKLLKSKIFKKYVPKRMYTTWHAHRKLSYIYRLFQPAVFFTRELYFRSGGIDRDLHFIMDWDLFYRFNHITAPKIIFEKLAKAHIHTSQKSSNTEFSVKLARASEIQEFLRERATTEYFFCFDKVFKVFCQTQGRLWKIKHTGFLLLLVHLSRLILSRKVKISHIYFSFKVLG